MRTSRQSSLALSGRQNLSTCCSGSCKETPYQFQSSTPPSTHGLDIFKLCALVWLRQSAVQRGSILQYADGTLLIAKNAKKLPAMPKPQAVWLNWRMKPKVLKCRALGLHSRTAQSSHYFNPRLSLCSEEIPFLDSGTILFLGVPITSIMSTTGHQELFYIKLLGLLNRVNSSPVTTKQKIRLYRDGVCPRLTGVSGNWTASLGFNASWSPKPAGS